MDSKQYLEDYISKTMKSDLTVAIKTILDEKDKLLESYNERVQEIIDLEEKVEQQRQQIEEMLEENIRRAEDEFEALSWEE